MATVDFDFGEFVEFLYELEVAEFAAAQLDFLDEGLVFNIHLFIDEEAAVSEDQLADFVGHVQVEQKLNKFIVYLGILHYQLQLLEILLFVYYLNQVDVVLYLDLRHYCQSQRKQLLNLCNLEDRIHYPYQLLLQLCCFYELSENELLERAAHFGCFEVVDCHSQTIHLHFENLVNAKHFDVLVLHEELYDLFLRDSECLRSCLSDEAEIVG